MYELGYVASHEQGGTTMDRRIILLSGAVASGKSMLAYQLANRFNMKLLRTSAVLRAKMARSDEPGRIALQDFGDELDQSTSGAWVLDSLRQMLEAEATSTNVVVDSVKIQAQIDAIRDVYGSLVTHIHMTAPLDVLTSRYESRESSSHRAEQLTYPDVRSNQTESLVDGLSEIADVVIDSNRCTEEDVLVRVGSHLRLFGETNFGWVDVIVGGQFGSEGKGQIAAYLAGDYDLLVRVGGPNAGHKVFEIPAPYTHHQLPSGTRRTAVPRLLIGAGAVLNVDALLKEISECNVDATRLKIDRNAMVIIEEDFATESDLVKGIVDAGTRLKIDRNAMVIIEEDFATESDLVKGIGSTGQGVGSATSRRILHRNLGTKLAKDVPQLEPFMCNALEVLQDAFAANGRVCLEGTQGTGLSLYHGIYPYVTSRDTNVSGCLAEAGIPPGKVRRVVMVCRTYPIRVENPDGGTSGPLSQEISFEAISDRSGIPLEELESTERTSTTDRARRIGEFDWELLRKASLLNRPTDIALTFSDYLTIENRAAKRFEQLHADTINFIQEIERVSGARVSLISTGFNPRSIIDRRSW